VLDYEHKNKTGYFVKNTTIVYDIGILLWLHISVFSDHLHQTYTGK